MFLQSSRGSLTRVIALGHGGLVGTSSSSCNLMVNTSVRALASSSSSSSSSSFTKRRPTPKAFQKAPKRKIRHKKAKPPIVIKDDISSIGPDAQAALDYLKRHGDLGPSVDDTLRGADYLTADIGTTEDLVGERRALMDAVSPEEAAKFKQALKELVIEERDRDFYEEIKLENSTLHDHSQDKALLAKEREEERQRQHDPFQMAFGDWSETIIKVDRVQKVQRGGTLVSYRALVIGGNLNGCAGFGVGKASAPNDACAIAQKKCKRNIFFIDRYLGSGITTDLAGRHNSCKVTLYAQRPNRGLHGNPLVLEILKYFGISDCTAKSHGNRNPYNQVYATFKAIMTHESMEQIAQKRGKRFLNLERAKRLQI